MSTRAKETCLPNSFMRRIVSVFGADSERWLLTPGSLIALRLWLARGHVQRLVLSTEEYYDAAHFPGMEVTRAKPEQLVAVARRVRAQAVIASLVSWRGRRLPVENWFSDLGSMPSKRKPLMFADVSHAGAAGFPTVKDLGADAVFGDPGRWMVPWIQKQNVGFLWVANSDLWPSARETFAPFYVAFEGRIDVRQCRWVDPQALEPLSNWFARNKTTRKLLRSRHAANMHLAREISRHLQLPDEPETSLLFSQHKLKHSALGPLLEAGLVWHPPDGGTRIMCRADLLNGKNLL